MCAQLLSFVLLFAVPWTAAHQAPLSMGFPRQEHRSGLPFLSPENLHDPGIEPVSLMSPALTCGFFTSTTTWEASFLPTNINFTKCFSMTAFLVAE